MYYSELRNIILDISLIKYSFYYKYKKRKYSLYISNNEDISYICFLRNP